MAIERKYERDIDLLLAEEFMTSPPFARWMWQKTRHAPLIATVAEVFVSKSTEDGESDLVVIYQLDGEKKFALLIEDKIDAPFQPDQELRYRKRGASAVEAGEFFDFMTVLCAPESYLKSRDTAQLFDIKISYGEVADFIRGADPSPRANYRADFVASAANRSESLWKRDDDPDTNEFWNLAHAIATREFPILEMKKPEMTKDSTWITIRPNFMPTGKKRTYIYLKGGWGFVDLTISNTDATQFARTAQGLLADGMSIHQTEKSAAIRIEVPPFEIPEGLEVTVPKIRTALVAAAKLAQFYKDHHLTLTQAAVGDPPA